MKGYRLKVGNNYVMEGNPRLGIPRTTDSKKEAKEFQTMEEVRNFESMCCIGLEIEIIFI